MLRRQATTIKLTPEDILEYDDSLAQKQLQRQQEQQKDQAHRSILQERDEGNTTQNYKDERGRDELPENSVQ
ncbi:uncharacterized protein CANTADRAFT_3988 [Suhomyces tanzawaensis NRRL Y-17324]|uniref:Anaphase-promoting complex, subunit CDC26 n=1 Tax=Suhomyces tanzawaensis NRRL Y-17324 TaxID=984487 RepID=A0A1E4SQZ5_9ASCO|nr:uncharacterized protein CANTADRAFT_3988 [Suhomyces tanzawaensis NRRL Y-17324]ODV81933.1 hypothetical protein CANTADRAFT_3988 [Suhomyces tanzawaensis NRRL Y-17324]